MMLNLLVNPDHKHFVDLCISSSLRKKKQHESFSAVMRSTEYFDLNHAEPVPAKDIDKPESSLFLIPLFFIPLYKVSCFSTCRAVICIYGVTFFFK